MTGGGHCDRPTSSDGPSRARLLEQLSTAIDLADAVQALAAFPLVPHLLDATGEPRLRPTVEVDLDALLSLWTQLSAWRTLENRDDDLGPALSPPAEI